MDVGVYAMTADPIPMSICRDPNLHLCVSVPANPIAVQYDYYFFQSQWAIICNMCRSMVTLSMQMNWKLQLHLPSAAAIEGATV
jgi:hypothetical protein